MESVHMARRWWSAWPVQVLSAVALLLCAGCPQAAAPADGLPEEYDVELPDGSVVASRIYSGPPVLENSTWAVYRESDDTLLVRVEFGPGGQVQRYFDNSFYHPSHLGTEILPDGQDHAFRVPSDATYRAATYGRSPGSQFGATMLLHAYWQGHRVGTGQASVAGTVSGNLFEGTFRYHSQLNLPFWSPLNRDDFEIYGIRE